MIRSVYAALQHLTTPNEAEAATLIPPLRLEKSVTPDHIISFEDGRPYKALKAHLTRRGLTPEQYRERWGLPTDYPMVAPNYAKRRSELAKSIGLGRKVAAAKLTAPATEAVSTAAETPKKRGRRKKAA